MIAVMFEALVQEVRRLFVSRDVAAIDSSRPHGVVDGEFAQGRRFGCQHLGRRPGPLF